jgi:uncharacterized protein
LDLALGRANVIHAALLEGAASEGFLRRCRKLALYLYGSHGVESPGQTFGPDPDEPD